MSVTNADEIVARGAEVLDADRPWWFHHVDGDTLHLITNCVLHQVYGNFGETAVRLGVWRSSFELGFNVPDVDVATSAEVEDAWRRLVAARREAT
jgi:hypothetical protein